MSRARRILIIWFVSLAGLFLSFLLPHVEVPVAGLISNSLQFLLFILSVYLVKFETVRKNKFLFVNFAALFGMALFFHLYNFIGTVLFVDEPMARHYYFQYVSHALYFFLLVFAVCYVTIDLLFRDFKVVQKYLLTLCIVAGFFAYYYHPYFADSRYLYSTQEIAEWRELDKASASYAQQHGSTATADELTAYLATTDARLFNSLSTDAQRERVHQLYPYLEGFNYTTLLFTPIYKNSIYMCVLAVGLILLFFGYQYKKDPPQGAYIEKMMFFFLMFCTLEIFHAWSFINTIEWNASVEILEIGQYLSAAVLGIIAIIFALRLRFITSVYGEFYEHEILERPAGITRWRDAMDNLVIAHFFKRNELVGRLFAEKKPRTTK